MSSYRMAISNETLKTVIREYRGFELSDAELELVRPEIEVYVAAVEQLEELDLANVMSSRLPRASTSDAGPTQQGGS